SRSASVSTLLIVAMVAPLLRTDQRSIRHRSITPIRRRSSGSYLSDNVRPWSVRQHRNRSQSAARRIVRDLSALSGENPAVRGFEPYPTPYTPGGTDGVRCGHGQDEHRSRRSARRDRDAAVQPEDEAGGRGPRAAAPGWRAAGYRGDPGARRL